MDDDGGGRRRRRRSGWPHFWFAVFAVIGVFVASNTDDPTPVREQPHITRDVCEGVPYAEGDAIGPLLDAGWTIVGSRVYPPHCGGAS